MDQRSPYNELLFPVAAGAGLTLRSALTSHCDSSDTAYCALLEESGFLYADAGDQSLRDHGETAALAVGAYHAMREVARRLGESAFEGIAHEGAARNFYISPVDGRFMLLSVFGPETRLALVRASATRTAPILRDLLQQGAPPELTPLPAAVHYRAAAPVPAVQHHGEGDFVIDRDYFLTAR
jgi:hypothetical protein